MPDTDKLIKKIDTEITAHEMYEDSTCGNGVITMFTKKDLTEIKGIVEENEKLWDRNKHLQETAHKMLLIPQPDSDLVEKVLKMLKRKLVFMISPTQELIVKAEIRKLLQSRQPEIDIKRLAHLLYISIPPLSKRGTLHYGDIIKAFEERLKDELK